MALIDPGVVLQLISVRFNAQAGSKVTLLLPGDPDPEQVAGSEKPFMRLLDIDITPEKNERSNDEDTDATHPSTGTIAVMAVVVVPEKVSRASFGAVGEAVGICAAALAGVTLRDDTAGIKVQVDLDAGPRMKLSVHPDSACGVLVGTVMWSGTCGRDAGRSIKAFMA